MIQDIDPELLAAGIAFALLSIDALRRYRNDERIRLYQLPWVEFRALFEFARKTLFTIDKPDSPSVIVDYSKSELEKRLAKQGVKFNHPFSYVYEGEILNGVFYYYDYDHELPHRQIHVRAFELEDGLELMCHEEPCWYAHPVEHLRGSDMTYHAANEWTVQRLHEHVPVGYPAD